MKIELEYTNPSEMYEVAYKKFFYSRYWKELISLIILIIISLICINFFEIDLVFQAIILFGSLFIFLLVLFYYIGPLQAIRKRRGRAVKIIIEEEQINVVGEESEVRSKLSSIKRAYKYDTYIFVSFENNLFVILNLNDIQEENYEWLFDRFGISYT